MGDFNDDPNNKSIQDALGAVGDRDQVNESSIFYNPMMAFYKKGIGTSCYRDKWNVLDQVHLSPSLLYESDANWYFWKAGIFNPNYLYNKRGVIKVIHFGVLRVVNLQVIIAITSPFTLLIKKQ